AGLLEIEVPDAEVRLHLGVGRERPPQVTGVARGGDAVERTADLEALIAVVDHAAVRTDRTAVEAIGRADGVVFGGGARAVTACAGGRGRAEERVEGGE